MYDIKLIRTLINVNVTSDIKLICTLINVNVTSDSVGEMYEASN